MRKPSWATVSSFVAVGGCVVFVFWQLHPSLLLANTTTAGGDLGAHVDLPAYLRAHLLTHGRLTGWSPDWYDGYPAFTFYFPVPSLAIALASFVIPYNIAFKLVTASGLVALPVAAWAFGRLSGMRRPAPECLAVATLPFLFDTTFTIYGGNIASTLAGEYSFSISLAIGLVFLGVVARGLENGRHRALAAGLLALTALCHMIPTIFVAFGAVVLVLMRRDRSSLRWAVPVALVGVAITGFWSVPFVLRQSYTTNMGWQKISTYVGSLFPSQQHWVLALALVGVLASIVLRRRMGLFLTIMTVASGAAFVLMPQGKLYNARLLPFWVLGLYLLAGVAVAELGGLTARAFRFAVDLRRSEPAAGGAGRLALQPGAVASSVTPVLAFAAAALMVLPPLVAMPSWFPLTVTQSVVPSWVHWDYEGYERKAAYPEYHALLTTMKRVGATDGCGRAMWEYQPEEVQLGTTMALMLLPYWTQGCVDSMEGLLFESSATTPYHFINQSELSQDPSRAMLGLPYGPLDVAAGVRHLQLLGVRYYMAVSPEAEAEAARDPALELVATSGPWPVTYGSEVEERTWQVYEVRSSAVVTPLQYEPAVLTGLGKGATAWLDSSLSWYGDPSRWDVPLAESGPPGWPRARAGRDPAPPRRKVAPVRVTGITTGDDRISFDVDRTGSPVLVKVSYFPNWQASGASGPWRVSPNLMVVVPTSKHVTLHYGYTPVDVAGWALTFCGLAGLVALALVGSLAFGDRRPAREQAASTAERAGGATSPGDQAPWELVGAPGERGDAVPPRPP